MDLWIGNATRQIYHFGYKLPDVDQPRNLRLDPGRQAKIVDLTREEMDYILKCHSIYGLVNQDDIDRTKTFAGTCYSVDKPITATRLTYLMDHNLGELVERGRQIRNENAVAQSKNVDRYLDETPLSARVAAMDLTIQQEQEDPKNAVPQMSVGTWVTEDESRPPPTQGRRRRAA